MSFVLPLVTIIDPDRMSPRLNWAQWALPMRKKGSDTVRSVDTNDINKWINRVSPDFFFEGNDPKGVYHGLTTYSWRVLSARNCVDFELNTDSKVEHLVRSIGFAHKEESMQLEEYAAQRGRVTVFVEKSSKEPHTQKN
jgi:hypothetical protein